MKHKVHCALSGASFAPALSAPARRTGMALGLNFLSFALAIMLIGTAVPVSAGPLFEVSTEAVIVLGPSDQDTLTAASGPIQVTSSIFNFGTGATARARAGAGTLGVFAFGQANSNNTGFGNFFMHGRGGAGALFRLDDLVISSPLVGEIATQLNLHISGVFGFNSGTNTTETGSASITIELPGLLTDGSGAREVTGSIRFIFDDHVLQTQRDGILSDLFAVDITDELQTFERVVKIDGNVRTPAFFAAVNEPLLLGLRLGASAQDSAPRFGGFGQVSSDLEQTLTFSTTGPVLDLPPGLTADSPSGGIADNRFVDVAQVPEPATLVLLGTGGAALLGGLGRRRRSQRGDRGRTRQ